MEMQRFITKYCWSCRVEFNSVWCVWGSVEGCIFGDLLSCVKWNKFRWCEQWIICVMKWFSWAFVWIFQFCAFIFYGRKCGHAHNTIFNYVRWISGCCTRSKWPTLHHWNIFASDCIHRFACIILHWTGLCPILLPIKPIYFNSPQA